MVAELPDVLIDKVRFGVSFDVDTYSADPLGELRQHMERRGMLLRNGEAHLVKLLVPGASSASPILADLRFVRRDKHHLTATRGSSITLNGMRVLRADLPAPAVGDLGLNGNDNVVGVTAGRARELLARQLPLIRAQVEAVRAAIITGLPSAILPLEQRFWLKEAEVCVDHASADPHQAVRNLQRFALRGSSEVVSDLFQARSSGGDRVPAVTYRDLKAGPALKIYAKREDLVRVEVACRSRDEVNHVLGRSDLEDLGPPRLDFTGDNGVQLLLDLARAVEERVRRLEEHLGEAGEGGRGLVETIAVLEPLYVLAKGERDRGGRPPEPGTVAAAKRALERLLQEGACNVAGASQRGALRRTLDALASAEGPLVKDRDRARYTLKPKP